MRQIAFAWLIAACFILPSQLRAENEVLQVLHVFESPGPLFPVGVLARTAGGSIYGISRDGTDFAGQNGYGTAYRIAPDGALSLLTLFRGTNGYYPSGGITEAADGNLYGMAESGGPDDGWGTIFRIDLDGNFTNVFSFHGTNGYSPRNTSLTLGRDGYLYGATDYGGTRMTEIYAGDGTVFKLSPEGEFRTLVFFNGTNGAHPAGPLLQARDGNLYGNTVDGGTYDFGTIFRISRTGEFTSLFSFAGTNGAAPASGLTEAEDGTLYGTTSGKGAYSAGTVYKITTNGILTTLAVFNGTNGRSPSGPLIAGKAGEFYGTTTLGGINDAGTTFKLTPDGQLTTLISFSEETGMWPGPLTKGADGNLYGATAVKGSLFGNGTVFRLVEPPKITSFHKGGAAIITWNSFPGGTYQIEYTTDLSSDWRAASDRITATGTTTSFSRPADPAITRFYRVALLPW